MKTITYLVNYACNEKCLFCFNPWRNKSNQYNFLPLKELTLNLKLKIIDKIFSYAPEMIVLSGGEPLLDKDVLQIIGHIHSKNVKTSLSLQTNATLLSDSVAKQLKDNNLSYLFVSLHGLEKEHNLLVNEFSFKKAVEGINAAVRNGIPVIINIVVTSKNIQIILQLLEFLSKLKISAVQLSALYPAGSALFNNDLFPAQNKIKDLFDLIFSKHHAFKIRLHAFDKKGLEKFEIDECGAGREEIAILPNGDVALCPAWKETYGNMLSDPKDFIVSNIQTAIYEFQKNCKDCNGCMLKLF